MKRRRQPRLGIFWFVPTADGSSRFVELSAPADEIPLIAGFRTIETGHVDHWPHVVRADPSLRDVPYEDYPRGRVNFIEEDDTWLLLLDQRLRRREFVDVVVAAWSLPRKSLRVETDSHYCSKHSIGLPSRKLS